MNEDQDLIKAICEVSYKPLQDASMNGAEQYRCYAIDCAILEDFNYINICHDERYKAMFDELESFKCPVLYWFEIVLPSTTKEILKSFGKYSRAGARKAIPAMRQTPYHDTSVLYVGKVKSRISHRIVTHLGYYKVRRTQGLQLYYWSKDIKLSLKLHVYTFKEEMAPMMTVIERGVADKLRPLLGKHK